MQRFILPMALLSLLATTVGCAQRMPTAPTVPSQDPASNPTVSDARQIQDLGGSGGMRSRMMTTTRRRGMGHHKMAMRKHKFLFFRGVYIEVDNPVRSGMRRADTTRRRDGTGRRAATTTRRRSFHSYGTTMD
ncbi:MAG TPA: hypothetical protein V6D05_11105 [Stenomitos sp.]